MLDYQIIVWPGSVEVVAESGVGAAGRHRVLGEGDPAFSVFLPTGAFLECWDAQVRPRVANDVMIAPEEWREAGIDGSRATVY